MKWLFGLIWCCKWLWQVVIICWYWFCYQYICTWNNILILWILSYFHCWFFSFLNSQNIGTRQDWQEGWFIPWCVVCFKTGTFISKLITLLYFLSYFSYRNNYAEGCCLTEISPFCLSYQYKPYIISCRPLYIQGMGFGIFGCNHQEVCKALINVHLCSWETSIPSSLLSISAIILDVILPLGVVMKITGTSLPQEINFGMPGWVLLGTEFPSKPASLSKYIYYFQTHLLIIRHITKVFATSSTYGWTYLKGFCATPNTSTKQDIKNSKTLGKTSDSLELTSVFYILHVSIFDGSWRHTKFLFNFLKFDNFSHIGLYFFWDLGDIS